MPDPTITIALAPLAEAINPIVNAVVSVALGAAGTYVAYLYHRWTGREMAEADQAALPPAVSRWGRPTSLRYPQCETV